MKTKRIEMDILEEEELEFISLYILDYIDGNRMPFLYNKDKVYSYPIAYNEILVDSLFNLMIDEREAEYKLGCVYDSLKLRSKHSKYYEDFTEKSIDEFINLPLSKKLVSIIQDHLITAYADDIKVNYFDSQLSLYLASSYFCFKDRIDTNRFEQPKDRLDLKQVFNHLKAIHYIENNTEADYEVYSNDKRIIDNENLDTYEGPYNYHIDIDGDILKVVYDGKGVINFLFFQNNGENQYRDSPEILITVPLKYYDIMIFNDPSEFNFEIWYNLVDKSDIHFVISNSYYSRLLLYKALDDEDVVLEIIRDKYEQLSSIINFRKEDVLTNIIGRYNRYLITKLYEVLHKDLEGYSSYSLHYIIAMILVEIGIAKSEGEFDGKRRYSEYLTDLVRNALKVPKV